MKNKRVLFFTLFLAMAMAVSGCGGNETPSPVVSNDNNAQRANTNVNENQDAEGQEKIVNENWQNEEQDKQNKNAIDETATLNEGEEIDTSDWQTYRNEEYGFEVKYHPDWEDGTYAFTEDYGKNIIWSNMFNNFNSPQKKTSIFPLLTLMLIDKEQLNFYISPAKYFGEKRINDFNFTIYKRVSGGDFNYKATIKIKDNYYFLVSVDQIEDNDNAKLILEQIISTFKFID